MGRVNEYTSVTKKVTAIQFVRKAILEVYDFLDNCDMSVSFKNDKFSGIIQDSSGMKFNVIGQDYIVKDELGSIAIYKPEDFEKNFVIIPNMGNQ